MADGDLEHLDEERLDGGNVTPVSRRGGTVLREAGPWTPTVHAVLAHARSEGMTAIPEPLGFAADGREIVSYVPGVVPAYPMPSWVWHESVLVQAARMLRAWHDATTGYSPEDAQWRLPAHAPAEVICHNDFAQYNLVFDLDGVLGPDGVDDADRVVGADGVDGARTAAAVLTGVIDFDTLSPGPRVWDIAYLAYRLVPYLDEPSAPDETQRSQRLELLLEAYGADTVPGDTTPEHVIETMTARLRELADFTDERAAETGRSDLLEHAAMYREHAARISASAA
ncbi:aminoglycoside phosphotransferase family protein [Humibacter soli]